MEEAGTRVISALAMVVAMILLARVALARWRNTPRQRRRRLRIVESCAFGPKQRLCIVEADGERLLVGATDGSIRLLRRLGSAGEGSARPESAAENVPAGLGRAARAGLRLLRGASPLAALALILIARAAAAAPPVAVGATVSDLAGALTAAAEPEQISGTLRVVLLLTLVSVAPSILLMATCFTRVLIVFAFLRQAIGVQQLPPSQVLVGLALFVTLFVMAPVGERIHGEALVPYMNHEIDAGVAAERAVVPVRDFLLAFTREKDLDLFVSLSGNASASSPSEVSLRMLLPAYMLSELRTAFEIGFMIYLPFLIIDLVVASMLISMGMIVLPPIVISMPFKLMLFVLLDGWNLVVQSLVSGLQ